MPLSMIKSYPFLTEKGVNGYFVLDLLVGLCYEILTLTCRLNLFEYLIKRRMV
jgi:hypothetical protein